MSESYNLPLDLLQRGRARYGDQFSSAALDPRFTPYYRTGTRIKVETCGIVMTGTVSATTGWVPSFLLMRTRRSIGSPWLLGTKDRILAVQHGRRYVAVSR